MAGGRIGTDLHGRANEMYIAHQLPPRRRSLPEPLLAQTITAASPGEKRPLQARVQRLRRETKDALMARVLRLERIVEQQKAAENALRNEITSDWPAPRIPGFGVRIAGSPW